LCCRENRFLQADIFKAAADIGEMYKIPCGLNAFHRFQYGGESMWPASLFDSSGGGTMLIQPANSVTVEPMAMSFKQQDLNRAISMLPRKKLADHKPFSDVYAPKTLMINATRAGLLVWAQELNQLNAYVESGKDINLYKWKNAINRSSGLFGYYIARFSTVSVVKKSFELIVVDSMPLLLADKLTKDAIKSAVRKFARYGRGWIALSKTFRTAMISNALGYAAILVVDLSEDLIRWTRNKSRTFNVTAAIPLVGRRIIVCLASWCGASVGFALGACLEQQYVGVLAGALTESMFSAAASSLLM
jgi:hypothetical protein